MFNKLIKFIKNLDSYEIYVAYLFGLRSIVERNNELLPRKRSLLYKRSLLCTPPFSFNEMPKYRGIDNLNTTLHLIINNFIKNQHKVVLNLDGTTNKFTTNQQKTVLNCDCITNLGRFLTNNFTTKQQIITNQQTGGQSLERGCHYNKEILK